MMMSPAPVPQRDDVPHCFGKEWDSREPECAGGPDPNFTDMNGSHIREQCHVFGPCGSRTQQLKAASNFIPAANLTRPPLVTPPPKPTVPQSNSFANYMNNKQAEFVERQRLAALAAPRPPAPPPAYQPQTPTYPTVPQGHFHSPARRFELNYEMPGFLTVPEERVEGEGLFSVLLREIIRGIFKAIGHVVAHSFDTRRLKEPGPPK